MKSLSDFFAAIAVLFGKNADTSSVSEVHQAVLDQIAGQNEALQNAALNTAQQRIAELEAENTALKSGDAEMRTQQDKLSERITNLETENAALKAENAEIKATITEDLTKGITGGNGGNGNTGIVLNANEKSLVASLRQKARQ